MKPIRCAFLLLTLTLGVLAANAQSWVSLGGPVRPHEVLDLAIGKSGSAQSIYAVDVDTVKLSADGGRTWSATGASYLTSSLAAACQAADPSIAVVGKVGTQSGVFRTSNGGTSWNPVGPSASYNLVPTRIAFSPDDPTLAFLGTERTPSDNQTTFWRSTTAGASWAAIDYFRTNATTFVNDILPHPADDNWVYVVGSVKDFIEDPDIEEEFSAPYKKGFWRSSNRGANWTRVGDLEPGDQNLTALAMSQYINTVIFVGSIQGTSPAKIYQSTNNGDNWAETCELDEGMTQVRALAVNPENQQMIVAATNADLFMTTDRGTNWDVASVPAVATNIYDVAFDLRDADTVYIATGASVYKGLYQGGYQWYWTVSTTGSNTLDVTAISVRSGVAFAVSSAWTGISKYSSGSWSMVGSFRKFGGYTVSTNNSDGAKVYTGGKLGQGGKVFQTSNSGSAWTEGASSGAGSYVSCVLADRKANSSYVWAGLTGTNVPNQNARRTTNNGSTWTSMATDHQGTAILCLEVNSSSGSSHSDMLFGGHSSYGLSRSTNAGDDWTDLGPNSFNITAAALNASTSSLSETVYLGESQSVWKSTNSGANASALQNVPFSGAKRLLMHPSYPNSADHLWAIPTNGQALYRTDNGGTSWTQVSTAGLQLPLNDLQSDPYNDSLIFVATSAGVNSIDPAPLGLTSLQSAPSGGHPGIRWNTHPESDVVRYKVYRYFRFCQYYLPNKQCGNPQDTVCVTPYGTTDTTYVDGDWNIVCYGCYGSNLRIAGYFVKAVDGGGNLSPGSPSLEYTVGGDDDPQEKVAVEQLPLEYSLSMNYPNPFNPTTTIRYVFPEDVHVRLTVVDILGREVGVLVDELQTAGYKDVIFDATNISSGVYFYKLTAGNFTEVKKMVVAR